MKGKGLGWIKVVVYAGLLAAVYYSAFAYLVAQWGREDYNYAYLMPFVVLYLLWDRREAFGAVAGRPSWVGLLPLSFGIGLYWLGELGGEYFTLYLSSWFVLVGLLWLHLGWAKLKTIGFALLMILTMFPLPNFIHNKVTLDMKLMASKLGVALIQAYGLSAYREGNVIDLGFTQLQVVDACSGLRYVFPLIVLGLLLAYLMRGAWWKKAVLVLSTLPISIVTNSLRVALTGILYEHVGRRAAEGFFHDFTGWFVFMASLALLLPEMWLLTRLPPRAPKRDEDRGGVRIRQGKSLFVPPRSRAQFAVAVVLLGVTAGVAQGVEFREKIPISRPLASFPLRLGPWQGTAEPLAQMYLEALDLSDYAIVEYRDPQGRAVNFYVAYYESQRKGESIHSPETCLPGSGWIFRQAGAATIPLPGVDGGSIRVNRAVMEKMGQKQLSYFWFPARGRVLLNAYELKLYTFWDALTRQRTDGALVRIITPVYSTESIEEAEHRLQQFSALAVPELKKFLPE